MLQGSPPTSPPFKGLSFALQTLISRTGPRGEQARAGGAAQSDSWRAQHRVRKKGEKGKKKEKKKGKKEEKRQKKRVKKKQSRHKQSETTVPQQHCPPPSEGPGQNDLCGPWVSFEGARLACSVREKEMGFRLGNFSGGYTPPPSAPTPLLSIPLTSPHIPSPSHSAPLPFSPLLPFPYRHRAT